MKVIFLDIDGVLCVTMKALGRDKFGYLFDQHLVDELQRVVDATGAKIVISSTWRILNGVDGMKEMWKLRGLPGEIIGVTPDCVELVREGDFEYYDRVERGHEIQQWIDQNPEITSYVIIDDDNDMLQSQQERFVHTIGNGWSDKDSLGLITERADNAIQILNTPL